MTVSKTIAIFNQAGGVAKTTLVHNLGYHLKELGHPTLVVDMDPQASLTTFMGLAPETLEKTVYNAVVDGEPLPIHADLHGLDLAPANIHLSVAESRLVNEMSREDRLEAALEPLKAEYDFILIDCPPSLGLLSILALTAATHVLVPIETQFKAFEGTNLLLDTVRRIRKKLNPQLQIAGFVPTRYDGRNSQDVRTVGAIQEQLAQLGSIFPPIVRSTAFADAAEARKPLALHNRKHPALEILEQISKSLETL